MNSEMFREIVKERLDAAIKYSGNSRNGDMGRAWEIAKKILDSIPDDPTKAKIIKLTTYIYLTHEGRVMAFGECLHNPTLATSGLKLELEFKQGEFPKD